MPATFVGPTGNNNIHGSGTVAVVLNGDGQSTQLLIDLSTAIKSVFPFAGDIDDLVIYVSALTGSNNLTGCQRLPGGQFLLTFASALSTSAGPTATFTYSY